MKAKFILVLFLFQICFSCKKLNKTISKSNMVTANITLKSESGASIFDEGAMVSSETIAQYLPSKSTIRNAKKALKSAGFEVNTNGIGLFVSTKIDNFEKVLNVKLIEPKSEKQAFKVDKKIIVPENWKEFIESIDLPEPVEYF